MKKKFGIDQTTAWLLSVAMSSGLFIAAYWAADKYADHQDAMLESGAHSEAQTKQPAEDEKGHHEEGGGHHEEAKAETHEKGGHHEEAKAETHEKGDHHEEAKAETHEKGGHHEEAKAETHEEKVKTGSKADPLVGGDEPEEGEHHAQPSRAKPGKKVTKHEAEPEEAPKTKAKPKIEDMDEPEGDHGQHGKTDAHSWAYNGPTGAERWGELDPRFATCGKGRAQSPVDLKNIKTNNELPPLQFDYKSVPIGLKHDGHGLVARYPAGSSIVFDLDRYELTGFGFHLPSEHTLQGIPYDMELQLMHRNGAGQIVMVGVLMEEGATAHPSLNRIWQRLPVKSGAEQPKIAFNVKELLPAKKAYFHYNGSLTTPPCQEGVKWVVMSEPIKVSNHQIDEFISIFRNNARPTQPLYGRTIQGSRGS